MIQFLLVFHILYTHQFTGSALFGPKRAKMPNSISSEPIFIEDWWKPQNDCKIQVSISVSYNIYPSDHPKYPFWAKMGQKWPKWSNSISSEPIVVEGWLTPQNDRRTQVYISVSHNICPSDHRKFPFWAKKGQKGPKRAKMPNSISYEPLFIEDWWKHQNDCRPHVSISVSYKIYPSDHRKYPFLGPKGPKVAKIVKFNIF